MASVNPPGGSSGSSGATGSNEPNRQEPTSILQKVKNAFKQATDTLGLTNRVELGLPCDKAEIDRPLEESFDLDFEDLSFVEQPLKESELQALATCKEKFSLDQVKLWVLSNKPPGLERLPRKLSLSFTNGISCDVWEPVKHVQDFSVYRKQQHQFFCFPYVYREGKIPWVGGLCKNTKEYNETLKAKLESAGVEALRPGEAQRVDGVNFPTWAEDSQFATMPHLILLPLDVKDPDSFDRGMSKAMGLMSEPLQKGECLMIYPFNSSVIGSQHNFVALAEQFLSVLRKCELKGSSSPHVDVLLNTSFPNIRGGTLSPLLSALGYSHEVCGGAAFIRGVNLGAVGLEPTKP